VECKFLDQMSCVLVVLSCDGRNTNWVVLSYDVRSINWVVLCRDVTSSGGQSQLYLVVIWPPSGFYEKNKNPIKIDGWNHRMKDKRGGQRMAKWRCRPIGTKLGRELVPLVARSYLTHDLPSVACMQIVRSNSNSRPRTSISCQHNLYV